MKKFILGLVVLAAVFTACEEEAVVVKDYGLNTFEADMAYNSEASYGEVAYTAQVYFSFTDSLVGTGAYGEDTWVAFYTAEDSAAYNVTGYYSAYDLVLTNYTTVIPYDTTYMEYGVTGVLLNTNQGLEVAVMEDTVSADYAEAFAALGLSDVSALSYSSQVDAIGYSWKSLNFATYLYDVSENLYYIIKKGEDTYKLRFTGFYGTSTDERVIQFEYQLMQ